MTDGPLVKGLTNPNAFPHPTREIAVVETHISWVILTGEYAYKIKKPLKLPFLDFSTLERRLFCCNEELRLNSRLAPDLYLDVVGIYGSPGNPSLDGVGEPLEYAVKMRQFPGERQLDVFLQDGHLDAKHIDDLAVYIAAFHQNSMAATTGEFGSAGTVAKNALENFELLATAPLDSIATGSETALQRWSAHQCRVLGPVFEDRKAASKIRECHGDLHLGNLALVGKKILAFDCIEFEPALRFIDVMDEIGFLFMDFLAHGHTQSAYRLLNRYLEISGDYAGLTVLNFYAVYRAMVRAKVTAVRLQQHPDEEELQKIKSTYERYINLADQLIQKREPLLVLMCGLSASGKSNVAERLMCTLRAVRIRSDLERKRLHDMQPLQHAKPNINSGIYSSQATTQLYQHLEALTREISDGGYSVIVDAAFLQPWQRDRFVALARQSAMPVMILWCHAEESVLRERIVQRTASASDPSDADESVLEYQLQHAILPQGAELSYTLKFDTAKGDAKILPAEIQRVLTRNKSAPLAM